MEKYAIIVAGGTGKRMDQEMPKQFLLLAGKPILMHSIERFYQYDNQLHIIVVIHPEFHEQWLQLCLKHSFPVIHLLVQGGKTRFNSVKNGLMKISGEGLVAVHDAARPIVTASLIGRTFEEAALYGNAIPCIPVNETIRIVLDNTVQMIDRTKLRAIQTPQVFEVSVLRKAYEQEYSDQFTDDASLVEALGLPVHLVEGNPSNIKITLPGDLPIAEVLISRQENQ